MIRKVIVIALVFFGFGLSAPSAYADNVPTVNVFRFGNSYETVQVSSWGDGNHIATIYTNSGYKDHGGVAHAMYWTGDSHIATFFGQSRGRQQVLGSSCGWFVCPSGNAVKFHPASGTFTPC